MYIQYIDLYIFYEQVFISYILSKVTIEVGKITPGGIFAMKCEKSGDNYYFTYKDNTYTHINEQKTFKIQDIDNAFETLYTMVKEGIETQPKEATILEFPDGFLYLMFEKSFGVKCVRFGHATSKSESAVVGYSSLFTKKQIDKLFGKAEK